MTEKMKLALTEKSTENQSQTQPPEGPASAAPPAPPAMAECPMAGMCAGMVKSQGSRATTTLVGVFFVLLGVAAIVEPTVLVVLVAALFILIGGGLIAFATHIGRGGHSGHVHHLR